MTMLASAGIYLALDVNSPLTGQHLNRYEPWTTYNENYLEHVFKVVEQFAAYNNTLCFFAGNEVVNDKKSARNSPVFIKKLISDIKTFIAAHTDRIVPVGYSAADDLNYRISLSRYLECSDGRIEDAVDFYGVNSYQWCGEQTFYTSGYDVLVRDYEDYVRPVFLSEFGCNLVTPRPFEEIGVIFSDEMIGVFSGGLVYEFSQEPNNYGLVEITSAGNAHVLADFDRLKSQFEAVEYPTGRHIAELYSKTGKKQKSDTKPVLECDVEYDNIDITGTVEESIAEGLIKTGVDVIKGKYVRLAKDDIYTTHKIYHSDGTPFEGDLYIKITKSLEGVSEYEAIRLQQLRSEGEYSQLFY